MSNTQCGYGYGNRPDGGGSHNDWEHHGIH